MRAGILSRFGLSAVLAGGACFASNDLRLIDAVKDQNRKAVESLIAGHVDVNAAQPDGATPLSWAVYLNQEEIALKLIAAGAKVTTADEYGETPLTLACGTGNATLIEKLLGSGANANDARWNGETALMIAARSGSVKGVQLLLDHGAKVEAVDSRKGQNALMWAAAEGHAGVVDLLLKHGADVKIASKAGYTPLVFAVQKGDTATVSSLLTAGADPNYMLPRGGSALQVAILSGKGKAAALLVDQGANVGVTDGSGNTPLHIAAYQGDVELVQHLLAKKADPNVRNAKVPPAKPGTPGAFFRQPGEQTPLLMAARANKEPVMRALVAAGADPKLKAEDGTTLLMAAASSGHIEAVKYAYELDPDVKAVTDRKSTVMHAAVTGSSFASTQPEICKVIQFLADKGAPLDELDGRGRTPISVANIIPIDTAVTLLANLIEASGQKPKQPPTR